MADFLDLPTLIIIAVAVFVLYRLRSVLGTRTGNERPPSRNFDGVSKDQDDQSQRKTNDQTDDVVVPLRPQSESGENDEEARDRAERKFQAELDRFVGDNQDLRKSLSAIGEADANFTPKSFQNGASAAYEMILTAFNAGDRATLKPLLDKDVYEGFESAIKQRETDGLTVDFTFVGLPEIAYVDAELDKRNASVTMRFGAEIVSATRDKSGQLVEGDAERVINVADEWTFQRAVKSRDPNWKLVGTNPLS